MPFCFKIIFQECLDQNNFSMAGWISLKLSGNFAPELTMPHKYTVEVCMPGLIKLRTVG